MIEVRNISFKYGDNEVLKNISATFNDGLHLIKGPNGSGKTTLCKVISGLLKPEKGDIIIDGYSVLKDGWKALERVIYIHDKPVVLNKTVYENLVFGAIIRNRQPLYLEKYIETFNLKSILNKNARELSTGYRQLVSILRAFIVEPRHIILDEPFSNLDEDYRDKILDLIKEYSKKYTVIIATHTPYLDNEANQIIYINKGRIKEIR